MTVAQISENAFNEYDKSLDEVAKDFYAQLLIILNKFSKDGTLVLNQSQLAQLEAKIYEALKDADYLKATDTYLKNFKKVKEADKKWYKAQKINVTDYILRKPQIEYTIQRAVDGLRQSGVRDFMIKPIANIIRQDVLLGLTYEAAAEKLRKQTIGTKIKLPNGEVKVDEGYIKRYAKQIAKDALNKTSRAVNAEVIRENKLTNYYYVGSLKDTSRPICIKLRELADGGTLNEEQVKKVVNEYCPNGEPSEELITVHVNGITKTMKKGSGMEPGTTPENFPDLCGGYECDHELLGVRLAKPAKKS
jgi:hypothetical protein